MAHNLNIENGKVAMMWVGQVPWHGLGTHLKEPPTAEDAIKAANLDWEVGLKPLYCGDGEHFYEYPLNRKAIVRLDKWGQPDCVPFGMVGNEYQVLQNQDAFSFFDPILATGMVTLETAGALGAGERVWVMARLKDDVDIAKDDAIQRYILLTTGHDGRTAVQIRFTPVRVVCQNTLTMSLATGSDFAKAYHVPGMKGLLQDAQLGIEAILTSFKELEANFRRMVGCKLDKQLLEKYLDGVFPDPPRRKNENDSSFQRQLARVEQIRTHAKQLFDNGKGNTAPPVKGTLWAAYNGIIEMLDHKSPYKDRYHRLESVWFGDAQQTKQAAYNVAVGMLT